MPVFYSVLNLKIKFIGEAAAITTAQFHNHKGITQTGFFPKYVNSTGV